MKNKIFFVLTFLLLKLTSLSFASEQCSNINTFWCDNRCPEYVNCLNGNLKSVFGGEHELKKMLPLVKNSETKGYINGFFLFGFGSINGEINQKEELTITFSWKMSDGTYALTTLPIRKIRVNTDNIVNKPYITFIYYINEERKYSTIDVYDSDLAKNIAYVTIYCNEKDWPTDINLPLNIEKNQ